jgi:hypothetical protein
MDIDVDPIPAVHYWARNTATATAGEGEKILGTLRKRSKMAKLKLSSLIIR